MAAIEPRTYSESKVIAMWTRDGSQEEVVSPAEEGGHSAPFRYSGASEKREKSATPAGG